MNRYLIFGIVLIFSLLSCKQELNNIEFCFLIDSTDKETQNQVSNILIGYKNGEELIIPSYETKVVVLADNEFVEYPLFSQNAVQEFMNFPLDNRKLEIYKKDIDISKIVDGSLDLSIIGENEYSRYLRTRNSDILYKKLVNSLESDISGEIQTTIDENSDSELGKLIVIALPKLKDNYTPTPPQEYEEIDEPGEESVNKETDTPNRSKRIGIAIVTTQRDDLHVRAEPRLRSEILFEMPKNAKADVLEIGDKDYVQGNESNWIKIRYDNSIGWAWGYHLRIIKD